MVDTSAAFGAAFAFQQVIENSTTSRTASLLQDDTTASGR